MADKQTEQAGPAEQISRAPTGPPPDANPTLVMVLALAVSAVGICLSLFQLWTAGLYAMEAMVQRSIHLAGILTLTFLLRPPFKGARKDKPSIWLLIDLILVGLAIYCTSYIIINLLDIFDRQGDWIPADRVVSWIGILLVMEACRRVIGNVMAVICGLFIIYAMYGPYMPDIIAHKGYSLERIGTTLWLTTEGIYGIPIKVAATFVYVFVLFGAFLEVSGGGNFFIEMAYALTGRFTGGPAKTSVVASGFMGSVSGSAVANVVATGSFTIPMMKRVGYRPHVAGAIEAAASTGGQLMPPIMGAGAFLMAEYTDTSYLYIIKIALVPAILYYVTVLMFVHFEAKKQGILGQPKESLPRAWTVLKNGLHFIIPVAILIYVLINNYSPMMAGFVAVVSTFLAGLVGSLVRQVYGATAAPKEQRTPFRPFGFVRDQGGQLLAALEKGAKNAVMVSVACAAAGIIVGAVNLTGMGLKFSSLVLDLSFGIKVIAILLIAMASLVLGMGLPVTASYIVLVTLAGPALLDMGVLLIVTHMVVFWYSQDANVTPPVSLASFAGAGVAGANPFPTALVSWKLAKGLYIIPIVMVYRPLLGIQPYISYARGTKKILPLAKQPLGYLPGPSDVIFAMVTCLVGLLAFAAVLERFFLRRLTWLEVFLFSLVAAWLFWPKPDLSAWLLPRWAQDCLGLIAFGLLMLAQVMYRPRGLDPLPGEAAGA